MPTISNQNYEALTPPANPPGWNQDSGFASAAGSQLAGVNSLSATGTGAKSAIYATQDGKSGNVTVSARFKVASPGASSKVILVGRLSDATPGNIATSANSYQGEITLGTSNTVDWRIVRQNGATTTVLATGNTALRTVLAANTDYEAFLTINGGTTPGTALTLEVRRTSDGLWLPGNGTFVALRQGCVGANDTAAPLTGQGYSGVRVDLASGATAYFDEFTLTDFLDTSTYQKIWSDDSGWTSGVGTATASAFADGGSGMVIVGDTTAKSVNSAHNDRQYANTSTGNARFKLSAHSNAVNAFFRSRNHRIMFNGTTSFVELWGPSGAVISGQTIAYTYANWTAGAEYRLIWRDTDSAIRRAVRRESDGFFLQPGGTFASGFTWAFNYAVVTPANPGQILTFNNTSNAVTMTVGTVTVGPAGTPQVTPSPATVPTSGTQAFAPLYFDGVFTTASVPTGGGSIASNVYTAPGSAGSATGRWAGLYQASQAVDVPITISAATATAFTLTAPSPASGLTNVASGNFTVTPNGSYTGSITITPSGGGLSAPIVLNFTTAAPQTFAITPTAAGTVTLTPTNSGGLANPSAVTYVASAPLAIVYVASNGNDATGNGSIGAPFLTIAAARAASVASPTIRLRGGDTFTPGFLTFTAGATVESYGTGRAILSNGGTAIRFNDCDGITLTNLRVINTLTSSPAIFFSSTDGVRRSGGITIDGVEASGGSIPVFFQAASGSAGGWNGVAIRNCSVHDCGAIGIYLTEAGAGSLTRHYSNVLIEDNAVYNVLGSGGNVGAGIVIGNADSVTGTGAAQCVIRRNHIYECGAQATSVAGPAGIFPIRSDGVLIESNLIHGIYASSAGTDGCGLDADVDASNCTFQRNYCYDCQGAGFLAFECGDGNVVRWNVFANCGTSSVAGLAGIRVDGLGSCTIHNNTVYCLGSTNSALHVTSVAKSANKRIYNNTFVSASGVPAASLPAGFGTGFDLRGNAYQTSNGVFLGRFNDVNYTSLAAFRAATGQEAGQGFTSSTPFTGYGSAIPAITAPSDIPTLTGFRVPAGNALAGAGLNLQSLFSINPGPTDFLGESVSAPYSVGGIDAAASGSSNATGYTLSVAPSSVAVGSSLVVTATLAGGTTLSAPLVITLADSLGSTINSTITINNGSNSGTTGVTPTVAGSHTLTGSHAGGGFSGGDGSVGYAATGAAAVASSYSLKLPPSPVAGQVYAIGLLINWPVTTQTTVTLADPSATFPGGATATIAIGSTYGSVNWTPTIAGVHTFGVSHSGQSGIADPSAGLAITVAAAGAGGTYPTAEEVADAILTRAFDLVEGPVPDRCMLQALRMSRNRFETNSNELIVYAEDDSTIAWRKPLRTNADALPITGFGEG